MACFLALIPNINPMYPLFHYIFFFAGFYVIPAVMGISFSPIFMLCVLALCSIGLRKIYNKYYSPKNQEVYYISAEQFAKHLEEFNKMNQSKEESDTNKEEDSNDTRNDL